MNASGNQIDKLDIERSNKLDDIVFSTVIALIPTLPANQPNTFCENIKSHIYLSFFKSILDESQIKQSKGTKKTRKGRRNNKKTAIRVEYDGEKVTRKLDALSNEFIQILSSEEDILTSYLQEKYRKFIEIESENVLIEQLSNSLVQFQESLKNMHDEYSDDSVKLAIIDRVLGNCILLTEELSSICSGQCIQPIKDLKGLKFEEIKKIIDLRTNTKKKGYSFYSIHRRLLGDDSDEFTKYLSMIFTVHFNLDFFMFDLDVTFSEWENSSSYLRDSFTETTTANLSELLQKMIDFKFVDESISSLPFDDLVTQYDKTIISLELPVFSVTIRTLIPFLESTEYDDFNTLPSAAKSMISYYVKKLITECSSKVSAENIQNVKDKKERFVSLIQSCHVPFLIESLKKVNNYFNPNDLSYYEDFQRFYYYRYHNLDDDEEFRKYSEKVFRTMKAFVNNFYNIENRYSILFSSNSVFDTLVHLEEQISDKPLAEFPKRLYAYIMLSHLEDDFETFSVTLKRMFGLDEYIIYLETNRTLLVSAIDQCMEYDCIINLCQLGLNLIKYLSNESQNFSPDMTLKEFFVIEKEFLQYNEFIKVISQPFLEITILINCRIPMKIDVSGLNRRTFRTVYHFIEDIYFFLASLKGSHFLLEEIQQRTNDLFRSYKDWMNIKLSKKDTKNPLSKLYEIKVIDFSLKYKLNKEFYQPFVNRIRELAKEHFDFVKENRNISVENIHDKICGFEEELDGVFADFTQVLMHRNPEISLEMDIDYYDRIEMWRFQDMRIEIKSLAENFVPFFLEKYPFFQSEESLPMKKFRKHCLNILDKKLENDRKSFMEGEFEKIVGLSKQ